MKNVFFTVFMLLAATVRADDPIAFLEARTARDPHDVASWNRLAALYLGKLRTTGDHDHLDAAERAVEASLAAVPAEENRGALALLIRVRAGGHHFAAARELAREWLALEPGNREAWQGLGDALLELGEYEEAGRAFRKMASLGPPTVATESRLARLDFLHGRTRAARRHLETALRLAGADAEARSWCLWQLGELAFGAGRYDVAGRHYRAAVEVFPDSIPARGAVAKVAAARGQVEAAMRAYEEAIALDPHPTFLAALADLHLARGEEEAAKALFARIEEGAADERDRRLDRRHLALIYADHGMRLEDAYAYAKADYAERQDIYADDTLAWCAFKSGRLVEAREAMKRALRLGTKDARLEAHARAIKRAARR
jgi:tetratricopeptide (TPR) repeat protein